MSASRFDTRSVPPAQRSRYLHDVVQDAFHLAADVVPLGTDALETTIEKHDLGDLSLSLVRGNSQRVRLGEGSAPRGVFVLFSHTPDGVIEADGVRQPLRPGCAYLFDARRQTSVQTLGGFEHFGLFVPLPSSEPIRSVIDRHPSGPLVLSGAVAGTLAVTLRAVLTHGPEVGAAAAPMVARSVLELLNAAIAESGAGTDAAREPLDAHHHRRRIRQYALARLGDPEMSIESIAAGVALSTRRIHQLFADSDMTLMRWIWSERLARCHRQLVAAVRADVRVGDVAYEWGFSDPAHFSRVFRQRYGVSPSRLLQPPDAAVAAVVDPADRQGVEAPMTGPRSRGFGATSSG